MAAMAPLALASLIGTGVTAAASISQAHSAGKSFKPPPQPQPEKAPSYDLFKRRNKSGPGAYAVPTPEALGAASTASTKIGQ